MGIAQDLAGEFDPDFYAAAYPDAAGADPLSDYWTRGAQAGRDPSADFSLAAYRDDYPDVAASPFDPFWHYIRIGRREGRRARPSPASALLAGEGPPAPEALRTLGAVLARGGREDLAARCRQAAREASDPGDATLIDIAAALRGNIWFDIGHLTELFAGAIGRRPETVTTLRMWLRLAEEWRPSASRAFDANWYRWRMRDAGGGPDAMANPFGHFVQTGIVEGRAPFAGALSIAEHTGGEGPKLSAALERCPARLLELIALKKLGNLPRLLMPERYGAAFGLPVEAENLLFHYIGAGWEGGRWPPAVFDAAFYRRAFAEAKADAPAAAATLHAGIDPFLHWMVHGVRENVVPTPFFDPDFYLSRNPDLATWSPPLFMHYWLSGMAQNRPAHPLFDARWYAREYRLPEDCPALFDLTERASPARRLAADMLAPMPSDLERAPDWITGPHAAQIHAIRQREARLEAPDLKALVAAAAELDPLVALPAGERRVRDPLRRLIGARLIDVTRQMTAALPRLRYDTVVLIPHCRMSGAARVAGLLTRAVDALEPGARLLVVTTEADIFERPDWFAPAADILSLTPLLGGATPGEREAVLHALIRGVGPRRVINVNSRLGWTLYTAYARTLKYQSALYAYLFCWDLDEDGNKFGYPVTGFQKAFDQLAGVFVDSTALKAELCERYMLAPDDRRLTVLHTATDWPGARDLSQNFARRRRAVAPLACMWASRFDRQKRFDLVVAIARAMPELEIRAWGKPVIGEVPIAADELPGNITLMGTFDEFGTLPLEEFDFLLYTAEWDGLPTILVDAGSFGLPIVASGVGGIGDLVDEATGWPVATFDDIAQYVTRVRAMVDAPDTVTARAAAMRARIGTQHSMAGYTARLADGLAERATEAPA
ncbi:MAG: hypothetical protein AcusKO_15370 [Acuticoccus sp.]